MWKYLVAVLAVGCGDNLVCEVDPQQLPPRGPLSDVELALPTDCVEGGISGIAGRWFVRDPGDQGLFHYPRYEQRCDGRIGTRGRVNDYDLGDDDNTSHQWSDGTYVYSYSFEHVQQQELATPAFVYETANLHVVCLRSDDTVGGAWAYYTSDFGMRTGPLVGTRFGPKDELASGLELLGEVATSSAGKPITAFNLVVEGDLAYVIGPTGLDIIDVANPAAPRALSHQDISGNDVRIVHVADRTYAYVAAGNTTVFDVTNPALPVLAKALGVYAHSLQISDGKLYLANITSSIPVYDYVTDPVTPPLLGDVYVGAAVHDLTVDGSRIFANGLVGGFYALDASSGLDTTVELGHLDSFFSHASWVGTTSTGRRLVLHGDESMSGTSEGGAFLKVLGGDPALPETFMKPIGGYQTRHEVGIHNFEMHGDRVYIAYYQDGVRVVDVSRPAEPREVAHYNTYDFEGARGTGFEGAFGIRYAGGLVYVADSSRGLLILREL